MCVHVFILNLLLFTLSSVLSGETSICFLQKKTKEEISSVVSQEAPFYTRNRRSALKEKKTNMAPTNNGT